MLSRNMIITHPNDATMIIPILVIIPLETGSGVLSMLHVIAKAKRKQEQQKEGFSSKNLYFSSLIQPLNIIS